MIRQALRAGALAFARALEANAVQPLKPVKPAPVQPSEQPPAAPPALRWVEAAPDDPGVEVYDDDEPLEASSSEASEPPSAVQAPPGLAWKRVSLAASSAPTYEMLRLLGVAPIARPCFETTEVGRDPEGNAVEVKKPSSVPLDDASFQVILDRELRPVFGHLRGLSGYDLKTQLPLLRSGQNHVFFPACGAKGATHSWGGPALNDADRALAALGWARYVASAGGPRDHADPGFGCLYEGYVAIMPKAAKLKDAFAAAQAAGVVVVANPEATRRTVLFGASPRAWLLTHIKPSLVERMADYGLDAESDE